MVLCFHAQKILRQTLNQSCIKLPSFRTDVKPKYNPNHAKEIFLQSCFSSLKKADKSPARKKLASQDQDLLRTCSTLNWNLGILMLHSLELKRFNLDFDTFFTEICAFKTDFTAFNNVDYLILESRRHELSFLFMKFSGKYWFLNSSELIFMLNQ